MVETRTLLQIRHAAPNERRRCLSKRACPIGNADLIGHDSQFVAFCAEATHRQKKIAAAKTVDPTCSQNDCRGVRSGNRTLARQLALAIHVQRVRCRILIVGRHLRAIEYVVGRIVNQQCADPLRLFCKNRRCCRIGGKRDIALALRTIGSAVCRITVETRRQSLRPVGATH